MSNGRQIEPIARLAGQARLMSAIGIFIFTVAFGISILQLFRLGNKIEKMTIQVDELRKEHEILKNENDDLKREADQLKWSNKILDDAIHLEMNRDYTNSIQKLDQVLKQDPNNETALYWESHAYYRLNEYDKSIRLAYQAINIDKDYFDPWVCLILDSHKLGQFNYTENCINYLINERIENYALLFSRTTEWVMLWRAYKKDFVKHEDKLRAIQADLLKLGYYRGKKDKIDAQVGLYTEQAVNLFYADHNIKEQLTVNELLKSLNLAVNVNSQ